MYSKKKTKISIIIKTLLVFIFLIVFGVFAYSNSLSGKFIWDDIFLIKNNTFIKDLSHLPRIFKSDIGSGGRSEFGFYRPFQVLTYMIDYSFWRLKPSGYHLTNILLHIFVALSVYWLINILFCNNLVALFTSAIFVVHPIHTEAVSYISGRADSLALLFMLLCFIFYIKQIDLSSVKIYFFILLSYTLALLSRENSLILPVLLMLYHYTFKKKIRRREFFSILGLAFFYILLRVTVLRHLLFNVQCSTNLLQRIPGLFVAIASYIKLLFLPLDLHMEYGKTLFNFNDSKAIFGIIILLSLLIYMVRIRNRNKLIFFALGWFFITLLPQSNLYPVNAYMAEHWLYMPSIGFFLVLNSGLVYLYTERKLKIFAIVIAIIFLSFYSYLTIKQNNYWKEPIVFYEKMLEYAPNSFKLLNNLGSVYRIIGKYDDAIVLYKKAIENNPNYANAYNNLGLTYKEIHKNDESLVMFKKAIEISPNLIEAYNNLAYLYNDIGKTDEAIVMLKKAIEINPYYEDAYYNLGNLYYEIGKRDEAIFMFNKVISLNPDYIEAYNNLAVLYHTIGKNKEAELLLKKALEINPNFKEVQENLEKLNKDKPKGSRKNSVTEK